jgi:hypothetical protein
MRRYYPDKNSSAEAARKTIEINAAYAVLGDAPARAAYDARHRNGMKGSAGDSSGSPPPPPHGSGSTEEPPPPRGRAEAPIFGKGGLIFASIITALVIGSVALTGSESTNANNTMNVDENLTTTDMNASAFDAVETKPIEQNVTQAIPPDLSKQPQTAVSYSTIEYAADRVAKIIVTKGIAGARAYSEHCHKAVRSAPSWDGADSCAAFDYAAAYIDGAVSTQAGWPKNGYFDFQSDNQPDDYAAVGGPSYVTNDRLTKIKSAAQDAAAEAFRREVGRMRADNTSQSGAAPGNSTEE